MQKVYLAGPLLGLKQSRAQGWRQHVTELLGRYDIEAYSPLRGEEFPLGPDDTIPAAPDAYDGVPVEPEVIFHRDRYDVMTSDLVFFNLIGATKVSLGSMVELGWADAYRKPIVVVANEHNNPHYAHPFLHAATPFITNSLAHAVTLTVGILKPKTRSAYEAEIAARSGFLSDPGNSISVPLGGDFSVRRCIE